MKKIKIYAPVDGVVRKLSYGKDAIFSKKILGDGCVIIPTDDKNLCSSYRKNWCNGRYRTCSGIYL